MRDKLMKMLQGTTAQEWAARTDLLKKLGCTGKQLDAELDALYASRQINKSKIIRANLEIDAIWITGCVAKASRSEFVINPKKLPPSGSLTRPTRAAQKEEVMPQTAPATEQKNQTQVSSQHIRDLVIAKPGIKRDDIYKALVFSDGRNKKKVGDLISASISTKHITQSDEGGIKRLHPGPRLNDVLASKKLNHITSAPKAKAQAAKFLTGEAARPHQLGPQPARSDKPPVESPSEIPAFLAKSDQAPEPAPAYVDNAIRNHLSAVVDIIPPGVILGVFRNMDGKMEFTLDTKAGACFNMGENLDAAIHGIKALSALQPFAEE